MAYYFKKGSSTQILALLICIIPALMYITSFVFQMSFEGNMANIFLTITALFNIGLYSAFMFSFAKIKIS